MRAVVGFVIVCIVPAHFMWAQFDLLTPSEAERIVQQIPPVVEAAKKWPCLTVTGTIGNPRDSALIDIEVRAPCSGYASSLIDRYVVDRRTGIVTTWGDNPSKVGDSASENFAKQLLAQARNRILSVGEGRCVALEAAESLPGWQGAASSTSIEPVAAPGSQQTLFWLQRKSISPSAEIRVQLYVDPSTGHVRNMASATEIMSAGLGELLAKLIALRFQPLLSDQDALLIALKLPNLAAVAQRKGCSLIVSSGFSPEEAQVTPACDDHYMNGQGVAVNLRNGLLSDPRTGTAIDAPAASTLAQSLVSAIREARLHLQEQVNAKCGIPERKP